MLLSGPGGAGAERPQRGAADAGEPGLPEEPVHRWPDPNPGGYGTMGAGGHVTRALHGTSLTGSACTWFCSQHGPALVCPCLALMNVVGGVTTCSCVPAEQRLQQQSHHRGDGLGGPSAGIQCCLRHAGHGRLPEPGAVSHQGHRGAVCRLQQGAAVSAAGLQHLQQLSLLQLQRLVRCLVLARHCPPQVPCCRCCAVHS